LTIFSNCQLIDLCRQLKQQDRYIFIMCNLEGDELEVFGMSVIRYPPQCNIRRYFRVHLAFIYS